RAPLALERDALERRTGERGDRNHLAERGEVDVLLPVVAVEKRDRAGLDRERQDEDGGLVRLTSDVHRELVIEALAGEPADHRRLALAGFRERARQVERYAEGRDARAIRARSVGVAAFSDLADDREERRVLEELRGEPEEGAERLVGRRGLFELGLR